jgi:hypothetical protein
LKLLSILNLESNLKFKIEFGLKPTGFSPAHQAGPKPQPTCWVGQTDPDSQLVSLTLSRVPLANPSCRRHRPAILVNSGDLRRRHLGQTMRPNDLCLLHQVDLADATSPRRSIAISGSGSARSDRLARCYGGSSRGTCSVLLR